MGNIEFRRKTASVDAQGITTLIRARLDVERELTDEDREQLVHLRRSVKIRLSCALAAVICSLVLAISLASWVPLIPAALVTVWAVFRGVPLHRYSDEVRTAYALELYIDAGVEMVAFKNRPLP